MGMMSSGIATACSIECGFMCFDQDQVSILFMQAGKVNSLSAKPHAVVRHIHALQARQWAQRPCQFGFIPLRSNDLDDLRRALATGFPVLVGIQVFQQSFMQSQGGVITMPEQVGPVQ